MDSQGDGEADVHAVSDHTAVVALTPSTLLFMVCD